MERVNWAQESSETEDRRPKTFPPHFRSSTLALIHPGALILLSYIHLIPITHLHITTQHLKAEMPSSLSLLPAADDLAFTSRLQRGFVAFVECFAPYWPSSGIEHSMYSEMVPELTCKRSLGARIGCRLVSYPWLPPTVHFRRKREISARFGKLKLRRTLRRSIPRSPLDACPITTLLHVRLVAVYEYIDRYTVQKKASGDTWERRSVCRFCGLAVLR